MCAESSAPAAGSTSCCTRSSALATTNRHTVSAAVVRLREDADGISKFPRAAEFTPMNADDKDLPTAMDEHHGAGGRNASAPLSEALHQLSKQDREARSPSDLRPPPGERNLSSDEHEEQLMNTVGAWLDSHAATAPRRAAARAHVREWMRANAAQVSSEQ